jgi:hypothetical protein
MPRGLGAVRATHVCALLARSAMGHQRKWSDGLATSALYPKGD